MLTLRQRVDRIFVVLTLHPILAVPVLAADLIGFAAMHLQHALHQPLFELFLNRNHSVLSTAHTEFVLTPVNATKAALLTAPLLWGCYFLNVLFYSAALLTIATLLDDSNVGLAPDIGRIWSVLATNRRRLLSFSGLAFLCLMLQLPLGYIIFSLADKVPTFTPIHSSNYAYSIVFIGELIAVAFLTRPAMTLLGEPQPGNNNVQLARILALIALVAQFAGLETIEHFPPSFSIKKPH